VGLTDGATVVGAREGDRVGVTVMGEEVGVVGSRVGALLGTAVVGERVGRAAVATSAFANRRPPLTAQYTWYSVSGVRPLKVKVMARSGDKYSMFD
jgi:hypothetical protein